MIRAANRRYTAHRALPALAAFALLSLPVHAPAQEPIQAGFTRPGSPSGPPAGGKVIGAVEDAEGLKTAFGGTVYYMVLERKGDDWATHLKDIDSRFHPGLDFAGASSPELDKTAKYLYLYQVVNDRHTKAPLQSVSVKLLVELKEVTSWGYFEGVGFALPGAAQGEKAGGKIRPVSFSNVVSALAQVYRQYAPAIPVAKPYDLVRVPTKHDQKVKEKKDINLVWDALDPASEPDYVMLLSGSDFDKKPAFRAIWRPDNLLPRDGRSVVFGFTSNLPPTIEAVRLRGVRPDEKGNIRPAAGKPGEDEEQVRADDAAAEQAVGTGKPGEDERLARADGRAPTPKPERVASEQMPMASTGKVPPMPATLGTPASGGGGLPGGFGGGPVAGGGGGGGSGGGGLGSGGGFGGGTGSAGTATGATTGTTTPGTTTTATTTPSTATPTQTQSVFFNPTNTNTNTNTDTNANSNRNVNTNQQAQAQAQTQRQRQRQGQQQQQRQSQHTHGAVVPAPTALLLAGLGLPVLFCLRRRKSA